MADRLVVRGDDSRVELWSAGRLQFEPKGWQRQMRDELRAALAEMRDDPGRVSPGELRRTLAATRERHDYVLSVA